MQPESTLLHPGIRRLELSSSDKKLTALSEEKTSARTKRMVH